MCVLALSATLGKGGEKMLLHSLESEEVPSARPVFPLAERQWRWTLPFTVDSDGRSQSRCGAREEDSQRCPWLCSRWASREEPQRSWEMQLCSASEVIDKQGTKVAWRPRARCFVSVSLR